VVLPNTFIVPTMNVHGKRSEIWKIIYDITQTQYQYAAMSEHDMEAILFAKYVGKKTAMLIYIHFYTMYTHV